ncbi:homoserine O-acetyltransferase MetX [Salisaeta longa]|uniref:homoserine O-acetyltransferase MetX n=1 Tax=Salisaeta longa TaxID=503170 RepID=UPI0003B36D77|nr:homoserine O-acetyltransferase [Salisaeta longa]
MPTLTFDRHTLESGAVLRDVPVTYRTWGQLNAAGTNALVVCHALTGTCDVADWWGPLLGPGRALDTDRYFVVCANALGSPYGTASPLTPNPATGRPYGPDFPAVTIRDTVRLHHRLVRRLGVRHVAAVVGGSMGGMQALEWAFTGSFVQALVPIAVGGRHTAWQIGWSAAQRAAIAADPAYNDGQYTDEQPPAAGLAVARQMAMVSYRSQPSFDARFGRSLQHPGGDGAAGAAAPYAVESYLQYQGDKLADRFDANCYMALTRQMDTHDVARGRGAYDEVLASIAQPALVVGIPSDVLYPLREQEELARHMPRATLETLHTPHGHDGFLIALDALNDLLRPWLQTHVPAAA